MDTQRDRERDTDTYIHRERHRQTQRHTYVHTCTHTGRWTYTCTIPVWKEGVEEVWKESQLPTTRADHKN